MKRALRFIVKNLWKLALVMLIFVILFGMKFFILILGLAIIIGVGLGFIFDKALKSKTQKFLIGIMFLTWLILCLICYILKFDLTSITILYWYMMLGVLYVVRNF